MLTPELSTATLVTLLVILFWVVKIASQQFLSSESADLRIFSYLKQKYHESYCLKIYDIITQTVDFHVHITKAVKIISFYLRPQT